MKNATLLFLIFFISAGNIHSEIDCKSAEYIEIENCINVDEKEIPSPAELERKYFDKSESKKDEYFKYTLSYCGIKIQITKKRERS